ncbi:MOB kinase activator-like 1A [Artemisia annua]|uniref:MOB kinase activator-like 1A n=1 Tax=Artemisia annua TaxID=35608 RepID=A0A2U1KT80_ARTAN|nr:MOB kinase activator-like 1A [Artemisia annua]
MRVRLVVGYAIGIVRGLRATTSWQGVYTNAAMAVVPALRGLQHKKHIDATLGNGNMREAFCTSSTCPTIIAGAKYENRWADGVTIKKPIVLSALEKAAEISCCLLDDNSCTEKVPASNFYSASSKIGFQGPAMDYGKLL